MSAGRVGGTVHLGGERGALDLGLGELNEPWTFQAKSRRRVSLGVPC